MTRSVQTSAPGHRSRLTFHVAFHGCGFLSLAFLSWFLVVLAPAQLGEHPGFLAGAFEPPQRCVEVFAFSDPYTRHQVLS